MSDIIVLVPPSGPSGAGFAPYITATLSFAGVVLGLLWNGWANRRAERRRADEDAAKRENEVHVLRTALWADLSNLSATLRSEIEFVRDRRFTFTWVPVLNFFQVYEKNLDQIGRLTREEVIDLARTYYTYNEWMDIWSGTSTPRAVTIFRTGMWEPVWMTPLAPQLKKR